ncbi:MAG TPA: hypothetical protein VJ326_03410 [Thermoplasmata archaeon]|nr:hypothetical protein [Thermoplasmata archaeon]
MVRPRDKGFEGGTTFAGDLDAEMRAFVWRAERRYGELLERWDGDVEEVSGVRAMTARLFL